MDNKKGLAGAALISAVFFSFFAFSLLFMSFIIPAEAVELPCMEENCSLQSDQYPNCGSDAHEGAFGEQCDDGNEIDGDDCYTECVIEDVCEPRTIGYWKQACKCHFIHESETTLLSYLDYVHNGTDLYDSISSFNQICEILNPETPASMEQRAKQQILALWFNVASGKIFLGTTIDLGSLSSSSTVEEALQEAESLLSSYPEKSKTLADTINNADHMEGVIIDCLPPTCGDGVVNEEEQCELPGTDNNEYCPQSTSECKGFKLGTRDAYGNCDSGCGCAQDPFTYSCVKGECGAECKQDSDCESNACYVTYDDYCTGLKLTEYNTNKIKDSTQVSNTAENACLADCSCTENTANCDPPDTHTYCVKGVCDAECSANSDCDDQNPNTIDTCLENCECKHESQCYCGDGKVGAGEQCELPGTNNNEYCSQSTSECKGFKLGARDAFGNCDSKCGCKQDNFTYSCVKGQCGAVCSSNSDCANKCVGQVRYFSGTCNTCSDCQCAYQSENCSLKSGWYNTETYQWASTGQCTEKEQRKKEYRDYSCSPSDCTYTITDTSWTDTGKTRNKADGTACNDGLYCTNPDTCTSGVCSGPQRSCNDGLYCTMNDRCDEGSDSCLYDQRECSDNLFCTVNERCDEAHDTCKNDPRDCSSHNLPPIATCLNNPDGNPFTWDYSQGFTSMCNEECDTCTSGSQTITHECSKSKCGAKCEQDSDCEPILSDSICHYGLHCSEGCACSGGQDEPCPAPGTVSDSVCYYGSRTCTEEGCSIQSCILGMRQICDPEDGCQMPACEYPVSINDFWGGYAEKLVFFPPGGGYDSSAKIYVPRSGNFSTISASMDLQGLMYYANSDVVLVTDVSGSMDDNCGADGYAQPGETPCKINDVKNATSIFVQSVLPLSDGISIGLASYRTELSSWLNLTRNGTALLHEIGSYHAEGFTCISCGISKGAEIAAAGEGKQKSIILLSDGAANRCLAGACTPIVAKDEAISESKRSWEQLGVRVYVIAFADNGDLATLQQIADAGNGTLVVANVTEIIEKYIEIASLIEDSYPTDPSLDIGGTGAIDWSHLGEFNTSETLADFVSKLDSVRMDCDCPGCTVQENLCVIDLKTFSSTLGAIRFFNLNITGCCYNGGTCLLETFCGDGSCNGDETCSSCTADCGQCPPQCGNGACESGETCSSCSSDCGSCGGGGGGGSICLPNWQCTDWTPCCEDGTSKRTCTDANNCGTLAGKPYERQFCIFTPLLESDYTHPEDGCEPGLQQCDSGSLMECMSDQTWVKVSDCPGAQQEEVVTTSQESAAQEPSALPVTGMLFSFPWPLILGAAGVAILSAGWKVAKASSRTHRHKPYRYSYMPK